MGCGASAADGKHKDDVVPMGKESPSPTNSASDVAVFKLESRVRELEQLVERQGQALVDVQAALRTVAKDMPLTFSVMQYNILAAYLGMNRKPWFLYGPRISAEQRAAIFKRYYERDEHGPKYGWPAYAQTILTPQDIEAIEREEQHFKWEYRKAKLVGKIRGFDADVVSLVELDQHEYLAESLKDSWDSVFHKRPRSASLDGCGIFWRRAKFALSAWQAFEFVDTIDGNGREQRDRCCVIVLLRWQTTGNPLVVVSTHLARNPEDRAQTVIRIRQVTQLVQCLTDFTEEHRVTDAPVVLLGDLNSQHFGEIRGIARTVWQIQGDPMHQFLWSASDVPTGPTSITNTRQCRIDIVQYMSNQLEVLDIVPVTKLPMGAVIPNVEHPSDHLPVCVKFRCKDTYQKHKQFARDWLECVAGQKKLHPLTEPELRIAFEFFDRDRSEKIDRLNLEEVCIELQSDMTCDVQKMLLECFPASEISYAHFVRAYESRLNHERMRSVGDLEHAFNFLADGSGSHMVSLQQLEETFREITPVTFSRAQIQSMMRRVMPTRQVRCSIDDGQEYVDLHKFCSIVCQATFPHRAKRRTTKPSAGGLQHPSVESDMALSCSLNQKLSNFHALIQPPQPLLGRAALSAPLQGSAVTDAWFGDGLVTATLTPSAPDMSQVVNSPFAVRELVE